MAEIIRSVTQVTRIWQKERINAIRRLHESPWWCQVGFLGGPAAKSNVTMFVESLLVVLDLTTSGVVFEKEQSYMEQARRR